MEKKLKRKGIDEATHWSVKASHHTFIYVNLPSEHLAEQAAL
jgi:hypothetical protein